MRILLIDPFSGAAGDMFLGALMDLGVDVEELRRGLATVALDGWSLEPERVQRAGIAAGKARVRLAVLGGGEEHCGGGHLETDHAHDPASAAAHPHGHHAPHVHGRSPAEILGLIDASGLPDPVKALASRAFTMLGEAEAHVHGTTLDRVHFHEVGAQDAILDICGTALGLHLLGIDKVFCRPVATGCGTFRCAHGEMPVPGPATLQLIRGMPVRETTIESELLTPTGAALIRACDPEFGAPPVFRVDAVGYGAGNDDRPGQPNVLRLVVGDVAEDSDPTPRAVLEVTFEVDDMTPEALGHLRERLSADHVVDCTFSPCEMKKGRPGHRVTLLVRESGLDAVEEAVFRHTTTFGFRVERKERRVLERDLVSVSTPFGDCRVKVGRLRGRVLRLHPEPDDVAALAVATGRAYETVAAAARAAAEAVVMPD